MTEPRTALVTGGCGFIGSHVVHALLADGWQVTNLDALSYAAQPANLAAVESSPNYRFVEGDVADLPLVCELVRGHDVVLNFAAETHVDRSLRNATSFVRTDVEGVVCLLEAVRQHPACHLVHMSTDEVFGSLPEPLEAAEEHPFAPTNPYSASKAAAELQLRAFAHSHGLAATVVRSCNVYGPHQHPEKLIPLAITNALDGRPIPIYGDGLHQREWLYIDDLVAALRRVLAQPRPSMPRVSAIHAGSGFCLPNQAVAERVCAFAGRPPSLITAVPDRPGHDRRYALDSSRLRALGWKPLVPFDEGLSRTFDWFRARASAAR